MNQDRLIIALDLETHLFRAGVPAPRIVCMSYAGLDEQPGLLLREDAIPFVHYLLDNDWELVGQNFRFDVICLCVEDWTLFPKFVRAYEEGRIHDIGIRDTLHHLGTQGLYDEDESEDGEAKPVRRQLGFSMADMVKRRFNVDLSGDKAKTKVKLNADGTETMTLEGSPDSWRLRYSELDGVPLDQWPLEARTYACDDAVWTIRVWKDQPEVIVNADMQTLSAFWLGLMGAYGVRTDPEMVVSLEGKLQHEYRVQNAVLIEAGLLKQKKVKGVWTWSKDMRALRRLVALSYGGEKALATLEEIYRNQDMRSNEKKAIAKAKTQAASKLKRENKAREKQGLPPLEEMAVSLPPVPESDEDDDDEGDDTPKVVSGVPMTEKGQVATDRDTLVKLVHPEAHKAAKDAYMEDMPKDLDSLQGEIPSVRPFCREAGALFMIDHKEFYNHFVMHEVGDRSGVEKLLKTFIPVLLQGTQVPINPRWNVLVATGRTSCAKPNLQQLPRKGGVRECFIPRYGYHYIGADYSFVELCTLAEFCYQKFGFSKLGDAINAGLDPHLDFAAALMGIPYEEAEARLAADDPQVVEMRQAAKCFHPDTEVLTRTGWKKILDLQSDEEVLAAEPGTGGTVEMHWDKPTQIIEQESPGELCHLKNEGIDIRVTADHRMLAFASYKGFPTTPKVVTPDEMPDVRYWANAGWLINDGPEGIDVDERLLRLAVATQADGNYQNNAIRFGFSKKRKIDRVLSLLHDGEFVMSLTSQGWTSIRVFDELANRVKALLDPDKTLPWSWLRLRPELRNVVLDEAEHWDSYTGSHAKDGSWSAKHLKATIYSSTLQKNVDVIQAISVMSGRKSRHTTDPRHESVRCIHADCHKVSMKHHALTRGGALKVKRIPYTGKVVCLSVPSSFVVVRDGGIPLVVGQCADFGYPGGLGAESFREYARATYGVTLTPQRAEELKVMFYRKWPEIKKYHNYIGSLAGDQHEFTITQLYSNRKRAGCNYTSGANSFFQGLAADGAKLAGWMIMRECYLEEPYSDIRYERLLEPIRAAVDILQLSGESPLYGSRPTVFAHDEVIAESEIHKAPEAGDRLAKVMIECMQVYTPHVKIRSEATITPRWLKGAKSIRDENGRLKVWTPKPKK